MKRFMRRFKRSNVFFRYIFYIISIVYFVTFIRFAKNIFGLVGIETAIRYLALFLFFVYFLIYLFVGVLKLLKKKYVVFSFLSIICVLFIIGFCIGATFLDFFIGKIRSLNERDKVKYTTYLITLKDTTLDSNSTLAMTSDEESIEGYILANKLIEEKGLKQKVEYYDNDTEDSFLSMLYALYDKKVDGIFLSSNYVTLYSNEEGLENLSIDTKVVYKKSEVLKNEDNDITSNKLLTDPFTVLIMGVDSAYDNLDANAAFNGDTLMLVTFNPKTLTASMLSIPRDSYVPIACRNNAMAKINSSAAHSTGCVIDTVSALLDVKIDYYVKINFKGVVDLVNAVGGVSVDVEAPNYSTNHGHDCKGKVCEQNSDREWGDKTIYLNPGLQTLNGEEALAYARCRGVYLEGDIARNRHQQEIIVSLSKKIAKIGSYNEFTKLLDVVSNNIASNMTTNQILSSYKVLKKMLTKATKNEELISIRKAKLETYNLPVYLPKSGLTTSALGYYEDSLQDIIKMMKINLEIEEYTPIKTFSFDMGIKYKETVAGEGKRSGASSTTVPNFIGKKKSVAVDYCDENNLDCKFVYVDNTSKYYNEEVDIDTIGSQNPYQGTLFNSSSLMTFYINGASYTD